MTESELLIIHRAMIRIGFSIIAAFGIYSVCAAAKPAHGAGVATILDFQNMARPLQTQIIRDKLGYAGLVGKIGSRDFRVIFTGCKRPEDRCRIASLQLPLSRALTNEVVNRWNAYTHFSRAYLDQDGRAVLEMPILLEGGLGGGTFGSLMQRWKDEAAEFSVLGG